MPKVITAVRPEPVAAEHVYVCYRDKGGRKIYDEVICQQHFEEMRQQGAYDARHGDVIEIAPWNGEPRCSVCEDHEA